MDYLIDTHVLLWWLMDDKRLNHKCREILTNKPVWCSVVSLWEITIKEQIGKIKVQESFMSDVKGCGFIWLDVQFDHLKTLRGLPPIHKDPFDRLIVSQAQTEELVLITADQNIQKYNTPLLRPD